MRFVCAGGAGGSCRYRGNERYVDKMLLVQVGREINWLSSSKAAKLSGSDQVTVKT